jgi:4a-hydroxytetrahydrobiopterin dehydratase
MPKLIERKSREMEKGTPPLARQRIDEYLREVPGWEVRDNTLTRTWKFNDYYQTMSFVIAVAMLSQSENHHPDMEVGYNRLVVKYSTHSVGGLSDNDFICAAKVNALMRDE